MSDDGSSAHSSTAKPSSVNTEAGNEVVIPITTTQDTQFLHDEHQQPADSQGALASTGFALASSPTTDRDCENQNPEAAESSRNSESGNEIAIPIAGDAAATPTQPPETENPDHQSMYRAASDGDWAAAEALLRRDEKLGWVEITEQGDRAIHLAVLGNHTEFVRKLIEKVGWEMLELFDQNRYTPCCYAAMDGNVELVRIMMKANPYIANVQNWYGRTPFALAISYGNIEIVTHLLSVTEIKGFAEEQWFSLLLVAIGRKLFDAALTVLEKKENLARMHGNDDRTALHVLAQLDISSGDNEKRQILAKKLWENIQTLGKDRVLELMKNPPILHVAAKVGNMDFIKMITFDYPDLLSHIDQDGHSMYHIIVMHRQSHMLELVKKARNVKNFSAVSLDKDGNTILHSAGKLRPPKGLKSVDEHDVHMQEAFDWFKTVEEIVPSIYKETRNNKEETPIELFWKEHANMLETSEKYMKKTAESCMLISTIVLTLVFTAVFAPPGGFHTSGIPTLLEKKWFASFIIFQVLALSSSTTSIVGFWTIISSNYQEDQFFLLSHYLRVSMCALLLSILFVISAFLSAFFLIFFHERKVLVTTFMLVFYLLLVAGISCEFFKVLRKTCSLQNKSPLGVSSGKKKNFWSQVFSCVPICIGKS